MIRNHPVRTRRVRNTLARDLIANPYAWPGGYPMYAIMDDGEALCADCTYAEYKNVLRSTGHDGWNVVALDINYEDTTLYCAHCNERIESAYGDDDE